MKDSVPDMMAALNSPSLEERREMRDPVSGVAATLATLRERLFAWLDKHPPLSGMAILGLVALGYNFSLYLLYGVLPSSNGWAIYWPYDGVTIGLLLMSSRRRWPWVLGGFLVASIYAEMQGKNLNVGALVDISGNLLEVLLAAYLLPPFHSLKEWMMEPNLVRRFTLYAILLGPAITSFPAAWYYGDVRSDGFWNIFVKWGFTDALGTALWLPLILVLVSRETYALFRFKALPQTLALLVGLFALSWFTFSQGRYPLAFVPYPMLLFVALRLGFSGAVIGVNMLALIAAYLSLRGPGPFCSSCQHWGDQQTVILQIYSTLGMLFVLPLSVILIERRNFAAQLQSALSDMRRLATVDQLTGVANRRSFDESLDTEWKRAVRDAAPLSLLMIDADHFKAFNDRYGHVAGDDCLRGIAAALGAKPLRQHDLVARYGGEEFAAILPGAPASIAEQIANQMRLSVLEACIRHEENPPGCVTVSVGCATVVPSTSMLPEELIAAADRALYLAKKSGRNCVYSDSPQ